MNVSEDQLFSTCVTRDIQVFVVSFVDFVIHVDLVSDTCAARQFCVCRHVRHIAHVFGSSGQGERMARRAAIDESLFSALSNSSNNMTPNHVAGDVPRYMYVWQHTVA